MLCSIEECNRRRLFSLTRSFSLSVLNSHCIQCTKCNEQYQREIIIQTLNTVEIQFAKKVIEQLFPIKHNHQFIRPTLPYQKPLIKRIAIPHKINKRRCS